MVYGVSKVGGGRGALNIINAKNEDWVSIQLQTLLVLTFLFTLRKCQVIFQWKQTKERLGNALSAWRNFWFRFDLANGKYLSIFLEAWQELAIFWSGYQFTRKSLRELYTRLTIQSSRRRALWNKSKSR